MDISNAVGKLIKMYRKERNLTLEDLARKVNISKTYLSLIENQARNINIKRIDEIATALGVPTTALLMEEVTEGAPDSKGEEFIEVVPHGGSPENRVRIQMVEIGEIYIGKRGRRKIIYRKIPLIDPATTADPGVFYSGSYPEGMVAVEIDCPQDIDDLTAFALRMGDNSMRPRVEKGDLLIACPSWKLKDKHMVVTKIGDAPAISRMLYRTGGAYQLVPLNSKSAPVVVAEDAVEWIYPVARVIANVY